MADLSLPSRGQATTSSVMSFSVATSPAAALAAAVVQRSAALPATLSPMTFEGSRAKRSLSQSRSPCDWVTDPAKGAMACMM